MSRKRKKQKVLVRARINWNQPGMAHRIPIDCAEAGRTMQVIGAGLKPVMVVEVGPDNGVCYCGAWQVIEGSPKTVARYLLAFPVKESSCA